MYELNWLERKNGNDNDCKDKNSTEISRRSKQKSNQSTKKLKYILPEIDRIIERIKPSVETRDECSLARHARCFMEVSSDSSKWLRLHKADTLPVYMKKKKKRKKMNTKISVKNYDEFENNDICSFDSDINLSGIVLTSMDKKIIENNRRKYHQSSEKTEKKKKKKLKTNKVK